MSDTLPGLIVLAIGGSIAPPLLLLITLFLGPRASPQRRCPCTRVRTITVVLCFVFGAFFLVRGLSGA
jgi:hypothetical protein